MARKITFIATYLWQNPFAIMLNLIDMHNRLNFINFNIRNEIMI
jgi:hypothetical protein